ncbi:LexA family protein [uncultured Sphingomonas sp.]|uniref:LexA family protein n=1 Tax=uncultured Sphingomonas sp. TaxID=158754 RepID=UPI003749BD7A
MSATSVPDQIGGKSTDRLPLRRNQVLAFVIEQIARHGLSPTMGEIARELRVSNSRAKQLIVQLVESGVIDRVPGSVRGLRVRNVAESRLQLTEVLQRLGWPAADPAGELRSAPDYPRMIAIVAHVEYTDFEEVGASPNPPVALIPPLEHLPDVGEAA